MRAGLCPGSRCGRRDSTPCHQVTILLPRVSPRPTLCAQALGDPSPPGQQTHLVHLWALAVHRAHPSLGPQACPASRGSHSILCWPGSQTAVPAGAAAGLVQGRARRWSPCPSWGRSWLGRELSWPTQPLTISLPRAPPSLSSGTYLPFPGPSPLGTT